MLPTPGLPTVRLPQSPNTFVFLSRTGGAGFHVQAQSEVFKEFGEISPLETMHAAKTLATATAEGSDILAGFSHEDVRLPKFVDPRGVLLQMLAASTCGSVAESHTARRGVGFLKSRSLSFSGPIWQPTLIS